MSVRSKLEAVVGAPKDTIKSAEFSFKGLRDALPRTQANTGFYMTPEPMEKYKPDQLVGIVVNGQHVHMGRTDPHVETVRTLLKEAHEAAIATDPQLKPKPNSQTHTIEFSKKVPIGGYLYTLIMVPPPPQTKDDTPMQGFREPYHIRVIRRIDEYQAAGTGSEVYPIMVGNWGHVLVDHDGGGVKKRPRLEF